MVTLLYINKGVTSFMCPDLLQEFLLRNTLSRVVTSRPVTESGEALFDVFLTVIDT